MNAFERQILAELKSVAKNSKLRERDLLEWRLREIAKRDGEYVVFLPITQAWVAMPDAMFKGVRAPIDGVKETKDGR